ncbi:hypothetical protein OIU74_015811 [Salix koriyanagi]|uniref:Uncharacterized protein n=1 Tax=Salix koriyanagi TaxID=2511006 RepID=A0A9Q0PNB6_9ROSI|nr:hypothetical protein OIU74_015811 [Salix koriyanagi]
MNGNLQSVILVTFLVIPAKNQGKKEILEGKIVENGNNTGSKVISTKTPLLDDQDTGEKEGPVTAAQEIVVPTAPKEGDMVSGATSPHGSSVAHQAAVPTAPMEGDKASGESSPHGSTNLDSMGQPKWQDRVKGQQGKKDHTGSIAMCMANKDSLGSSVHERDRDKGKGHLAAANCGQSHLPIDNQAYAVEGPISAEASLLHQPSLSTGLPS